MTAQAREVLPGRQPRGRQPAAAAAERTEQADPDRRNALNSGHRACQGCGEALAARYVARHRDRARPDGRLVTVNATGCLEVFSTPYPESSWQLPWLHSLFANAASVASGVAAALRATGRDDIRVLAQGGDGGTVDIGLACLSGMFERNDDVLYVCYDNEAYMNTGVQRSGATPPAARTATTEAVGAGTGQPVRAWARTLPRIAMAHDIPYVATATVAELHDLEAKVHQGHVDARRALPARARARARSAGARRPAETSSSPAWPSAADCSRCTRPSTARSRRSLPIRGRVPVEEYLRPQRRYAHLFGDAGRPGHRRPAAGHRRPQHRPLRAARPRRPD